MKNLGLLLSCVAITQLLVCGTVFSLEGARFYIGDAIRNIRKMPTHPLLEKERVNFRRMVTWAPPAFILGCIWAWYIR